MKRFETILVIALMVSQDEICESQHGDLIMNLIISLCSQQDSSIGRGELSPYTDDICAPCSVEVFY